MWQNIPWDKNMWNNLGYILSICFFIPLISSYLFKIQDKIIFTVIWFLISFALYFWFLLLKNYLNINWYFIYSQNELIENRKKYWTYPIEEIETGTRILPSSYVANLIVEVLIKTKVEWKIVTSNTTFSKKDLPADMYEKIYQSYTLHDRLIWAKDKYKNEIENFLKDRYDIYLWKELIVYQNPDDPNDFIIKNPFEDQNSQNKS